MIIELKITIIIVYLYFCLVAAAVVVDYDDVLFFSFCLNSLLVAFAAVAVCLFVCLYVPFFFLLLSFSFLDFSLGSAYL